jgi:hypothetical protein
VGEDGALPPPGATLQPLFAPGLPAPEPPKPLPVLTPLPSPVLPPESPVEPPSPLLKPPKPPLDEVLPLEALPEEVLPAEALPVEALPLDVVDEPLLLDVLPVVLLPLLDDELLDPPLHAAPHELLKQSTKAVTSWSLLHEAGGVCEVTQVVHVASSAQACSWEQQEAVRQSSQATTPVVKPQVCPPLELVDDEELLVVTLPLEDDEELPEVPPQASGFVPLGSAPPGGATQA